MKLQILVTKIGVTTVLVCKIVKYLCSRVACLQDTFAVHNSSAI